MANFQVRDKGTPFRQVIDIPTTSTDSLPIVILTTPVYDTLWLELEGTVGTNPIDFFIQNITDLGSPPATNVDGVAVGPVKIAHLVLGIPSNVPIVYGSTRVQILISRTGGVDGTFTGKVTLYGTRRT